MFKKLKENGWGLAIVVFIYLWVLSLYFEYIINREVMEEVQIVLTLGVLVGAVYIIKHIISFIYKYLKTEQND